jgi:hypothetical protein
MRVNPAIRPFFSATSIALALTTLVCITAFAQVPPLISIDEPAVEEAADDARDSAPSLPETRPLPRTPWDLPPLPSINKKTDGIDKKMPPSSRDSGPMLPSDNGSKYVPDFDQVPGIDRQPGTAPGDAPKLPARTDDGAIPGTPVESVEPADRARAPGAGEGTPKIDDLSVPTETDPATDLPDLDQARPPFRGAVEIWTPPAADANDTDKPRLIVEPDRANDADTTAAPVDRPDPSTLRRDDPPRGPIDLDVPPVDSGVSSVDAAEDRPKIRVIGPVTEEPASGEDRPGQDSQVQNPPTVRRETGDAPAIPSVMISPGIDAPSATFEEDSPNIANLIAKYTDSATDSPETDAAIVRLSDESEALLTLLRDRRDTLADRAAEYRNLYRAGQVTLGAALEAHRELLDAELELAPSEREKVAIYENQLEYIKTVEGIAEQRGSQADQLDCRSLRLRIEIALHRAKTSNFTLAEVQVLRNCVESTGSILKDAVAKNNAGAWRGDTAAVFQAGVEHCLAQADLATAVNDTATAAEHLQAAATFCEGLTMSTKASFDAGGKPLEDVLRAQLLHAQVQLKALKLEKE